MRRRRPDDRAPVTVPPELAAGPRVLTWCSDADRETLEIVAGDHPHRSAVVFHAQHGAWAAFHRARNAWLAEHGYTLRELRAEGSLRFRPPYFDGPGAG